MADWGFVSPLEVEPTDSPYDIWLFGSPFWRWREDE